METTEEKTQKVDAEKHDDKTIVPYIVHEGILARLERVIRRLWIAVILLIVLLVGCNIAWLVYEAQYETVQSYQIKQDIDGGDYSNTRMITINDKENKTND